MSTQQDKAHCCGRGGARPGCGRKPGVKTKPVRLPQWLIDQLAPQGDLRELILTACIEQYQLQPPAKENDTE